MVIVYIFVVHLTDEIKRLQPTHISMTSLKDPNVGTMNLTKVQRRYELPKNELLLKQSKVFVCVYSKIIDTSFCHYLQTIISSSHRILKQ